MSRILGLAVRKLLTPKAKAPGPHLLRAWVHPIDLARSNNASSSVDEARIVFDPTPASGTTGALMIGLGVSGGFRSPKKYHASTLGCYGAS